MKKLLLGAGALLALAACTDGDKICDSGDSRCGEHTGDVTDDSTAECDYATEIDTLDWNCDSSDYWYDVYLIGWGTSPDLYIYQTGSSNPWDEAHSFPADSYDFDPNGCWDNHYLQLARTDDWQAVVSGSTTLYECSDDRAATLTWHLEVYDADGASADCVVWGDDPSSLGTGCDEWI
jgi:hypothetical protein